MVTSSLVIINMPQNSTQPVESIFFTILFIESSDYRFVSDGVCKSPLIDTIITYAAAVLGQNYIEYT